eukprot:GSChrysophyteH1.ASY1.ANO1.672.1 assembled CDS
MEDNFLRTGDLVTFKYVRFQSYLSGEGILNEDVFVNPKISSFEDHLFQVCAQRQYSAKLEYEDFLEKTGGDENEMEESAKKHFTALVRGKGNEIRMNEVYMKHKIGNNVLFGDTVQLLHIKSRKYLTVKPGVVARDERENMSVYLSSEGDQYSWIQLLPRYKIDREGDQVNASMETGSPWRMNIYQSSQNGIDPSLLMSGQLVYIKDPEFSTHLQLFTMPFIDDYGNIVLKPGNDDNIDTNSIWVLEGRSIIRGGPVYWKQEPLLLRHLNTGEYLCAIDTGEDEYVSDSCIFSTVDNAADRGALLNFIELHSERDALQNGKAIQLRQGHMFLERTEYIDRFKSFTCAGTRNRMKATNLIITSFEEKATSAQLGYDVAMDVHVGISIHHIVLKFLSLTKVPSVRDIKQSSIWPDIDTSERTTFFEAVESIMFFVQGYPLACDATTRAAFKPKESVIRRRQTLFREQGTLEGLLLLLYKLIPISERLSTGDAAPSQFNEGGLLSTARSVVSASLRLLAELTHGNPDNQMLVAEYMNVVLAHCSTEKIAATITQEMLSTNRVLQETKMGIDEIQIFSEKLRDSQMNAMFLGLIKACCSCQGVGVSQNQINIAKILLGEFKTEFIGVDVSYENPRAMDWTQLMKAFAETMMGSFLYKQGAPVVTLTWTNKDKRLNPMTLFNKNEQANAGSSLFATQGVSKDPGEVSAMSRESRYKLSIGDFFGAQISLAADMCFDRNYTVISQLIPIYPYDALISIVRKRSTPSFTKAACLSLLNNMYVDCDPQVHVMLPRLTRTWSEISTENAATIRCVEDSELFKFGLLQVTISEHVRELAGSAYKLETRQMMKLLHKLLEFSFYGTTERLLDVIDPIVAALDRSGSKFIEDAVEDTSMQNSGPKTRGRRSSVVDSSSRHSESTKESKESAIKSDKVEEIEEDEEAVPWQARLLDIFESLHTTFFMLFLVLVSVSLVLYLYLTDTEGSLYDIAEYVIFSIFALDVLIRAYCFKVVRGPISVFICDPFNMLDIAVVAIDIALFIVTEIFNNMTTGDTSDVTKVAKIARLLRLMRIMRVVRILNAIATNLAGVEIFAAKWEDPQRYYKSPKETVLTMVEMTQILSTVQLTVEDRNISLLMHGFFHWYQQFKEEPTSSEESAAEAVTTFDSVTESMESLRDLVQAAMSILMTHHSSKKVLLSNIQRMQVLVNHRRETQFQKLDKLVLLLKRESDTHDIWGRLQTEEHKHTSSEAHRALKEIKLTCYRRREILEFDEAFEPDRIIQDILRNLGMFDVCVKIIQLLDGIDPHNPNSEQSRNTRTLALEASELLYWFTLGNAENQALAYKHITFFMKHIDGKVMLHKVLEAIFKNNEFLMKSIPKQYIYDCIDMIITTGRFMQYLSLLGSIVAAGEKNMIDNQYEIIRILASPNNIKKVLLYFVPTSHPEYQKKVKAMGAAAHKKDVSVDDLPSDLAYHLNLMSLLSGCTVGRDNMTTIEAKVQSMYSFVDVVEALLDPHTILVAKIRTGLFFYNAMLDVEMRLPSLKDAKCMWDLIETFPEKNGWAATTSCRQKVEWMIVCAQMVYGYFGLYFDNTVFRPEVGQASNVERVNIREKRAYELINNIFFKIRSVYEMQSPLLATEHQAHLYDALCALNDANPNKIVIQVENLHSHVETGEIYDEAVKSAREETKLREFIAAIRDNEDVAELLESETQDFIAKLEKLPRVADTSVSSDVRYEVLLTRIVNHIGDSIQTHVLGDEVVKFIDEKVTRTNIWFIKIFRTMIENRWGMTIHERDDDGGEEQDEAAAEIMQTLNECGVTKVCLNLLGKGVNDELQAEAIKLIVALLFKEGGALAVQTTIYETLNGSGTDLFFLHVRNMLQDLMTWHKWQGAVTLEEGEEPDLPDEIILVRMLQLMSEGHYRPNQDIMREQPNNRLTVNLLDDFVQYLQILDDTSAAIAVTATVLEVIQGPCEKNQDHFALNTELLETLNRRMRHHVVGDCEEDEENEVKKCAIEIFQGLLEGQGRRPAIYDRVLSVIHLDVIKMICLSEPEEDTEEVESWEDLKTECLVFLMMLFDFDPKLREELEMEDSDDSDDAVVCVEVIWRGELQRRFFPVPEICGDIAKSSKDDFIVSADRESPESKLFDLIGAARSMHREVLHQQLLKEWNVAAVFSKSNQDLAMRFNFVLASLINALFLIYYENVDCDPDTVKDDDGGLPASLGFVLIVVASYTVILCFVVRLPVKYEGEIEMGHTPFVASINTAMDGKTVYHAGYLVFAALSVSKEFHHLASFLLLDIISLSPVTQETLDAIWKPRRLLFMTVILMLIVCYIYAIFAFFLYNNEDNFNPESMGGPVDMSSLEAAFKTFTRYGSPSGSLNNDMAQN